MKPISAALVASLIVLSTGIVEAEFTKEQAIDHAWNAFDKERFNRDNFSLQEARYDKVVKQLTLNEIKRLSQIHPEAATTLRKIRDDFGQGPAWRVTFRRSRNVLETGDWHDLQPSAIILLFFDTGGVALLDRRFARHPTDKLAQNRRGE